MDTSSDRISDMSLIRLGQGRSTLGGQGVTTHIGRFFLEGGQGGQFFWRDPKKPCFCLNLTKLS